MPRPGRGRGIRRPCSRGRTEGPHDPHRADPPRQGDGSVSKWGEREAGSGRDLSVLGARRGRFCSVRALLCDVAVTSSRSPPLRCGVSPAVGCCGHSSALPLTFSMSIFRAGNCRPPSPAPPAWPCLGTLRRRSVGDNHFAGPKAAIRSCVVAISCVVAGTVSGAPPPPHPSGHPPQPPATPSAPRPEHRPPTAGSFRKLSGPHRGLALT